VFIDFTGDRSFVSASVVRIVISRFQMSLAEKILEAFDCHTIKIGSLDTEKPYPITHTQLVGTRFGPAVRPEEVVSA
jgi:hypothetical protein